MALQISYDGFWPGADHVLTVYWFPREPDRPADYVTRALGASHSSSKDVDVTGTPEEIASWTTAAVLFVEQVAAALEEQRKVQRRLRRWNRPGTGRRASAKWGDAHASFLERARPAAAVYQPVRDVIEVRLAEQKAHALETSRRAYQERERRWMEAVARFREWESRQAVADRPLPGGLSPRQMAARGDSPTSWPPEVQAAVGDLAVWWAGVRSSVRNRQARAQAVQKVTEAITTTTTALEKAGRPGVSTIKAGPDEVLHGWWIHFNWSDLPDNTRLRTPPEVPPDYIDEKGWHHELFLPPGTIFTVSGSGAFGFAQELRFVRNLSGYGSTHQWSKWTTEQFAERLIPAEITAYKALGGNRLTLPITDHADPDAYVPYVEAVARRAAAHFHALIPGQL